MKKKDSFNFNFKESISVYFFKSKKTELSLLYEALVTKIVFFLLLILFFKIFKVNGRISFKREILSNKIILFNLLLYLFSRFFTSSLKCFPSKIKKGKIRTLSKLLEYFIRHSSKDGLFTSK